MENNEIMNEGIEMMVEEVVAKKRNGIGVGGMTAIVLGLVGLVTTGIVFGKKLVAHNKAKNAANMPDKEIIVDEDDLVDVATK
jgi:hypothetical protein